jgi:hypothetical protein
MSDKVTVRLSVRITTKEFNQYTSETREQSAIIAAIFAQDRIFGEIYLDNRSDGAAFAVSDRDHLMLVSIGMGAVQRNF